MAVLGSTTLTGLASIDSNSSTIPVVLNNSSSVTEGTTCRAWVLFDGTGTPSIRNDFNVTSITDDGVGEYIVNITNALPDVDFATVTSGRLSTLTYIRSLVGSRPLTTTTIEVLTGRSTSSAPEDFDYVSVAVFH